MECALSAASSARRFSVSDVSLSGRSTKIRRVMNSRISGRRRNNLLSCCRSRNSRWSVRSAPTRRIDSSLFACLAERRPLDAATVRLLVPRGRRCTGHGVTRGNVICELCHRVAEPYTNTTRRENEVHDPRRITWAPSSCMNQGLAVASRRARRARLHLLLRMNKKAHGH